MSQRLKSYQENVYSQCGEDGVIAQIFNIIPEQEVYWCEEFGAWDGVLHSNTCNLIKNSGWNGVLIEASTKKYKELKANYSEVGNAILVNKKISFEGEDRLDSVLGQTEIPNDFDLLSIDVDGNDYHIWDSMILYKPKIVPVEFNFTIPSDISYVQKRDFDTNHGNSLLALVNLGKQKGYELVTTTECNGFFVRKEYFHLFEIEDNSIDTLWDTQGETPRVMQMYDGTLVLSSDFRMPWNGWKVGKLDLQKVPKFARQFGDSTDVSFFKKVLLLDYNRIIKMRE